MPGLPRVTSLLPSGKAALRLAAGTASLATGGWVLRALHDAPASLGAGPGAIGPVADRSPHYRDGVFHNIEPASPLRLDTEENRLILFDMLSSRSVSRPRGTVNPDSRGPARRRMSITYPIF